MKTLYEENRILLSVCKTFDMVNDLYYPFWCRENAEKIPEIRKFIDETFNALKPFQKFSKDKEGDYTLFFRTICFFRRAWNHLDNRRGRGVHIEKLYHPKRLKINFDLEKEQNRRHKVDRLVMHPLKFDFEKKYK